MLPGPPAIYQTILNHPDVERVRPVVAAPRGHRRRASCPSSWSVQLREELGVRDGRHRLRPHRDHRHRHHVPPRRRPRDHRQHLGPADPRRSRCRSSTTTATRCPTGEPGEVVDARLQRDDGLLRRPGGHRRDHRRRRLAAHRRRRVRRRRRQRHHHRPHQGHVHRRRLQRLPGRDRGADARAPGPSRRSRSSACPTSAWARWAWRSSCRPPGARGRPRRGARVGAASTWPTSRRRATSRWSTRCRSTPAARC